MEQRWQAYIRDEFGKEHIQNTDSKERAQRLLSDARSIFRRCGVKVAETRIAQIR